MKKISILSFISVFILMMFGCQNQRTLPTVPAGTMTPPNVESTVAAVMTSAAIANATGTAAAQKTATAAAGLYTSTVTSTITQSPNATLTVQAILTIVANANATGTAEARLTQTFVAGLWTPTCTPTLTPTPVGGEHWTYSTTVTQFSPRYSHTSLVYNGVMWVIGGNDGTKKNDVWSSSDGITWNWSTLSAGFSARDSHSSVVYEIGSGLKMWVIGGYDDTLSLKNDVWNSSNGINWSPVQLAAGFTARDGFAALVFNNKMWVIGGYDGSYRNDVWSSSDGSFWTQLTAAAQFSARARFTALVYNNQMWVIGGYDGSYKNDVWRSSDGIIWTQVSTSGFNGRSLHTSVVYDDGTGSGLKMWVIGGLDIVGNLKNDVWSSGDGVVWTQATAAAQFSPRDGHTSVVYNNQMWVIAGYINPGYVSDVWHSQ